MAQEKHAGTDASINESTNKVTVAKDCERKSNNNNEEPTTATREEDNKRKSSDINDENEQQMVAKNSPAPMVEARASLPYQPPPEEAAEEKDGTDDNMRSLMQRSQWKIKKRPRPKLKEGQICSICLREANSKLANGLESGALIRTCQCPGLRSHQHEICVNQWLEETGSQRCPYCHYYYSFDKRQKTFLDYVHEHDMHQDWAFCLGAFLFSLYVLLIGSVLSYFSYSVYLFRRSHRISSSSQNQNHSSNSPEQPSHPLYIAMIILWTTTLLFALAILSTSVDFIIRQYIKFNYWRQTHYSIRITPLLGPSEPAGSS